MILAIGFALAASVSGQNLNEVADFSVDIESQRLSSFALKVHHYLEQRKLGAGIVEADDVIVADPSDPFGDSASDDPIDYESSLPSFGKKSGAADIIALEVLFQTLNYYGVKHSIQKRGSSYAFKLTSSKHPGFNDLTNAEVAFAIRTFSKFLLAHLCGDGSQDNVYRVFSQIKPEAIGLRFMNDMTFALLGNELPKQPNEVYALGTKWKAIMDILNSLSWSKDAQKDSPELKSWLIGMSDIVNALQKINRLVCYIDIRPKPREELKKRIVNTRLLTLKTRFAERYPDQKEILDAAKKAGTQSILEELNRN